MSVKYKVESEETYNAVNCWRLSMTMVQAPMKTVLTWWMAKSDLHMVHGRLQMYMNQTLVQTQEFDPSQAPEQGGEPPAPINVDYVVGYETVTVQAGTFTDCVRVEVEQEEQLVRSWAHQNVPIFGLVKSEVYTDSELVMVLELVAYGG
ncbi:hypothetical protein KEJ47_09070 [Candidatus Bathyarchaeota archaeon]|nr:hypothetical protein [Candidatus Bathyarchaeota archaeon]